MAGAPLRDRPRRSVKWFRGFLESRPDEERWELIDGVAMMTAPATLAHQRIASNLERLLNGALEGHAPTLTAYQRIGLDLAPRVENYYPEPDVVVVEVAAGLDIDAVHVDRFYLAAEIVSSGDRAYIEGKRGVYQSHDACKCVLTVQQDRQEVRVDLRIDSGWQARVLTKPDDALALADFGLQCKVSDLYRGTALAPRSGKLR